MENKQITDSQRKMLLNFAKEAFQEKEVYTAWQLVRWLALRTGTIESRACKGVEIMVQEGFVERFEQDEKLCFRIKTSNL